MNKHNKILVGESGPSPEFGFSETGVMHSMLGKIFIRQHLEIFFFFSLGNRIDISWKSSPSAEFAQSGKVSTII